MITLEDGGFERVLEHFTLHPFDFALTSQLVRNFAPSPNLSDLITRFHTSFSSECEIVLQSLVLV